MKKMGAPVKMQHQHGSVLVITILLLISLTIIGLSTVVLNTTQTRIATNSADQQIAFQTAEGALAEAQQFILDGVAKNTLNVSSFVDSTSSSTGLYVTNPSNQKPLWNTVKWGAGAVQSFKGKSAQPSAYIVELLPPFHVKGTPQNQRTLAFRISARAIGANLASPSPVILQTVFQIST